MRSSAKRMLVIGLILGVSACLLAPGPAAGASPSFTLWTDGVTGWSTTNMSFTNPGPDLVVYLGDNVTLVLNSTDGAPHTWFLDYNNNTNQNPGEPESGTFRDLALSWNFTADRSGTFPYRDGRNRNLMGNITILPGSSPGALDTSVVIAIGAVIAFVAVVALLYFFMRKPAKKSGKE